MNKYAQQYFSYYQEALDKLALGPANPVVGPSPINPVVYPNKIKPLPSNVAQPVTRTDALNAMDDKKKLHMKKMQDIRDNAELARAKGLAASNLAKG